MLSDQKQPKNFYNKMQSNSMSCIKCYFYELLLWLCDVRSIRIVPKAQKNTQLEVDVLHFNSY